MTTMNISLPDQLKKFVDERVARAGYSTSSEYLRELIRRDQDRLYLRDLLLEGAESGLTGEVRKKDDVRLWIFKSYNDRNDNLLCVAVVLEACLVVKTVMHHFELE